MCNRNGTKMFGKTPQYLSHLIIYVCLLMTLTQKVHSDKNNDINETMIIENEGETHRQGRWFPFYTIGRFVNTPCLGSNQLLGTCVTAGECTNAGGVATGSCNTITRQAICCIYQQTCDSSTSNNNTYFVSPKYPGLWSGGSCGITVNPCSSTSCQLRVEFLDLSLVGPNGDGTCNTDAITITGGATSVPALCGENSGQHVVVEFDGTSPIIITIAATSSYTFGRHWFIRATQYGCDSPYQAPAGCLQYYMSSSGVVRSFNYSPSPNSQPNSIGVEGSRQIANLAYGICFQVMPNMCSISYTVLSNDIYSFTLTGDVGAVDPSLLSTSTLQEQSCTTDFIIIPNPSQGSTTLTSGSDRFCGLGLASTTSNILPFVLYVVTDGNENLDIGNRGFALSYSQNQCPVL